LLQKVKYHTSLRPAVGLLGNQDDLMAGLFPAKCCSWFGPGCLLVVCLAVFAHSAEAPEEYERKALLLLNVAHYVEWPAEAFAEDGPFVIGILGRTELSKAAPGALEGKRTRNRKVVVINYESARDAGNCHLLYIAPSERPRVRSILEALQGRPVLTVSEMRDFARAGGVMVLRIDEKTARFRINHNAASAAGLVFSPRLLKSAEEVVEPKPGE
jgi:hypothetical protein